MKCPNCGAEVSHSDEKCDYCDSEIVRDAPQGAGFRIDPNASKAKVFCAQCGGQRIRFQREAAPKKKNKPVTYRTIGVCQDCGYSWNPDSVNSAQQKRKILWWVVVICFCPISLSVWFYKTEKIKLKKPYKIIILALFWLWPFLLMPFLPERNTPANPTPDNAIVEYASEKAEFSLFTDAL